MTEAVTIPSKYIFLDVVGFTQNRSVEAQTEIVDLLNGVVISAIAANNIDSSARILLPTGDGICLVFLNIETPYDVHVRTALSVIEGVEMHNATEEDEQRRFKIRIGINSNVDNLITDVNGNRNIAGAGINLAQRIMNFADGNQIMVGQPVYDMLSQREKYMHAFRPYVAEAKHDFRLNVYQLAVDGHIGLDVTAPSQFREVPRGPQAEAKLSGLAAHYMAHAMLHRPEIAAYVNRSRGAYPLVVLLWLLARDSYGATQKDLPELPDVIRARNYEAGFHRQFEFYESQDLWMCIELSNFIELHELRSDRRFFERGGTAAIWGLHFVSPEGQRKLKKDWPDIWERFNLEASSNLEPQASSDQPRES